MIRWTVPLCRHFPTSKLYQIITLRGCRPIHIINQPAGVHSCRSLTCRRLPSFTRAATTLSSTKVSLVPSLPHQYQMTEGQNCLSGQDPSASVLSLSLYVVMHVFAFSVWNGYPILARTRKIEASESAACFFIQCKIKGSRGRGANESSKIKQEPCTFIFFVLVTESRSSHPGSCKFDTLRKWHMEAARTIKSIKWSPLVGYYRLA